MLSGTPSLKKFNADLDRFYREAFLKEFYCCRRQANSFAIRLGLREALEIKNWVCDTCERVWLDIHGPSQQTPPF